MVDCCCLLEVGGWLVEIVAGRVAFDPWADPWPAEQASSTSPYDLALLLFEPQYEFRSSVTVTVAHTAVHFLIALQCVSLCTKNSVLLNLVEPFSFMGDQCL